MGIGVAFTDAKPSSLRMLQHDNEFDFILSNFIWTVESGTPILEPSKKLLLGSGLGAIVGMNRGRSKQ